MLTQNATLAVSRVFVDEVLECAHREGLDVAALLERLDLSYSDLDKITPAEFAHVWLEISQGIGDEFFGLAQRPMAPGSFTLMGHAVRAAKTFEVALRRALRFLRVVLGEPFGVLCINGKRCTVELADTGGPRSAFAYRTFFLILHGLNCWLVRERIPLLSIQFPCLEPAARNDYGDFFGTPVRFDADCAALSFDARYLQRPVRRNEQDLKVFLRTTPESLLRGYRPTLGLKARVQAACFEADVRHWPSAETIARQFGYSKSTLHRRLREEGHSVTSIREEARRTLAMSLLRSTDLSVSEIAAKVGYAEPSAFHRSFRKWYATTPSKMRRMS